MAQHRTSTPPQIIDEASEWFIAMREPSVSADDRAAFADWLRASPAHVGAYMEVAKLWADVARISPGIAADLGEVPAANVIAIREGGDRPRSAKPAVTESEGTMPRRRTGRMRRLAVAASLVLLGAASLVAWRVFSADTFSTDIGEQRVITLQDSSVIRLNSRTKVAVRMTAKRREIELRAGQALFEVAQDAARPFIVTSGNVAVRAVGTQFDVNQKSSGTVVTVVEGRVQVDAESRAPPAASTKPGNESHPRGSFDVEPVVLFVSAGEQVHVARDGAIDPAQKTDTAAAISWLQQELRFDGQPLSDVLEEFNRYTHVPIVLRDSGLGDLRVNAVFHTTNPDSLLNYVSRLPGAQVERTDTEIRISRRP